MYPFPLLSLLAHETKTRILSIFLRFDYSDDIDAPSPVNIWLLFYFIGENINEIRKHDYFPFVALFTVHALQQLVHR